MSIKAVIYDLGGVIIGINYQLTAKAFTELGATDFDGIYSQFKQSNLFDKYETGAIDCSTFRSGLRELLSLPSISDEEFDWAWNAMLLDIPMENLNAVTNMKSQGIRTFLFSNTNPIHLKRVLEISKDTTGVNTFDAYFDEQYYSHLFGMRKPYKEAFQKILFEQALNPNETLFVDDSPQHVEGARQAGLHAILINNQVTVTDLPELIRSSELNRHIDTYTPSVSLPSRAG